MCEILQTCLFMTWTNVSQATSQQAGWMMKQGIDGSARKPALRQDTGYMVKKTYHDIAPYLGAFGAYLMPQ